jgi:ceramide glucosyltransferase
MIARALLTFILAACVLGCAYWIAALICLRVVLKRRKAAGPTSFRSVSILKPVKGMDAEALENFSSFSRQDYPDFEIIFGVADAADPAVATINQLIRDFPSRPIRLIVAPPLGVNPKAAILHALAADARGDVLVITDSDIRVTPDFLQRVVPPLEDPAIGLVTCLYRGQSPGNLPAKLEALHMDATFAQSAALAWTFGATVGFGATLAMRREELLRAGGYAACSDYLLDDYEIAARIRKLGLRIHLSDYVVAGVLGATDFSQQWTRELRWSRGIRTTGAGRYLGQAITFSVPLALLACVFCRVWPWAWAALPIALSVRSIVAWQAARLMGQRRRRYLVWLPVRDLMSAVVWAAGLFGKTVAWRGQRFVLRRDGRLELPSRLPDNLLARSIRRLDAHLRHKQGIFEFAQDPRCIFRVSVATAPAEIRFANGARVAAGKPVGILHLWNEQVPLTPPDGADLRSGMLLRKSFSISFEALATAARSDPRLAEVEAFGADAVFVTRNGDTLVARLAARYGFEWIAPDRKPTFSARLHAVGENFLILGLQWAFNPAGLRGKVFFRPREPLWISRRALLTRYGAHRSVGPP